MKMMQLSWLLRKKKSFSKTFESRRNPWNTCFLLGSLLSELTRFLKSKEEKLKRKPKMK